MEKVASVVNGDNRVLKEEVGSFLRIYSGLTCHKRVNVSQNIIPIYTKQGLRHIRYSICVHGQA